MRPSYALLIALCCTGVDAQTIPPLICREDALLRVDPAALQAQRSRGDVTMRFREGNLYLADPGRPEYLYNTVVQLEPLRYSAGHKVILFSSDAWSSAIVVHAHAQDIRISRVACSRP